MPNPTEETKKRIKEVLNKVRKAWTKLKIIDWLCETYNLSDRQAYDYYHDALYWLQQAHSNEDDAKAIRAEQIERIITMMDEALSAKDFKTATKCQEMLNKIYQLYVEKKEVDVTVKDMQFKFGDE